MSELRIKPSGQSGKVFDITPQTARTGLCPDWSYVGFGLYKLAEGDSVSELTEQTEVILVLVEGRADITADGQNFGELGSRMDVFEKTPPACVYVPGDSRWSAAATTDCTLAVCTAPAGGHYPARILGPEGIETTPRGQGNNLRHINNVAMEDSDVAHSLLVTEVFTPSGNWSSYPPHRHDEDDFPNITYLEEVYYHRLNPQQGYGHQRVFSEDGSLDESIIVENEDVVLVPRGHHPCGVPYGYEMYYLNVMAGPLRKWRFKNHPDHNWIYERDQG